MFLAVHFPIPNSFISDAAFQAWPYNAQCCVLSSIQTVKKSRTLGVASNSNVCVHKSVTIYDGMLCSYYVMFCFNLKHLVPKLYILCIIVWCLPQHFADIVPELLGLGPVQHEMTHLHWLTPHKCGCFTMVKVYPCSHAHVLVRQVCCYLQMFLSCSIYPLLVLVDCMNFHRWLAVNNSRYSYMLFTGYNGISISDIIFFIGCRAHL